MHKDILEQNFGVTLVREDRVDIGSSFGKALLKKYDIKNVPTIILSSEGKHYEGLQSVWGQVGTVESDGSFIFRNLNLLAGITYKDLETKEVVVSES